MHRRPADPERFLSTPAPRIQPIVGEPQKSSGHEREFTFLVGSHFYGSPFEDQDKPARALEESIDILAESTDRFLFSVGDMVFRASEESFTKITDLLARTGLPTYNAPGNHDWTFPKLYRERFGKSYGCMRYGTALFVVLNTDLDSWFIRGPQLEFFRRAMSFAKEEAFIKQVFIFAHRQIFALRDPRYFSLLLHSNAIDNIELRENYVRDIKPLIKDVAASKTVVWFASDVGITAYYNPFHDLDPATGVTFVGSVFFNGPRDCMVRVKVAQDGSVSYELLSLAEPILEPLEQLDMAHWQAKIDALGK